MSQWPTHKLEAMVTKVGSGATPRGGEASYSKSGVPLIRSMNVHCEGFVYEGLAFLNDEQAAELDSVTVHANDVLLNITGASIGRVTIAPENLDGARVNQHVCIIRPLPVLKPKFLANYLASPDSQQWIFEQESGATRQALTKGKILEFDIPVPPAAEQERIVSTLDSYFTRLDSAIATLERVQRNLKRYRASVLKSAVEGRLVPTEAELARAEGRDYEPASKLLERILVERRRRWEEAELAKMKAAGKAPKDDKWKAKYEEPAAPDTSGLPELPEGWCWATIEQISQRVTVGHVGSMQSEYRDEGIPFLRSQNVRENAFNPDGLKYISSEFHQQLSKSTLHPGDVLIVRSGSVGVSCVVPEHLDVANCSDLVIVQMPCIEPQFIAFFMNSIAKGAVRRQQVGIALIHFNTKSAAALTIPIPPKTEQQRIVNETSRYLSVIDENDVLVRAQLSRSQRLRQSILKWAFEGKLADQDPNDEPASVLLERIRAERAATQDDNQKTARKAGRPAKRS